LPVSFYQQAGKASNLVFLRHLTSCRKEVTVRNELASKEYVRALS